jgi:predicted DNA-binding ribbon-helix-helix protein
VICGRQFDGQILFQAQNSIIFRNLRGTVDIESKFWTMVMSLAQNRDSEEKR